MAIRIGHDLPADLALADVDPPRPQRDEAVDLCLLIAAGGRSEIEMQPVLPRLLHQRRAAPRDLRTAARRAYRRLLVLIPDQRPTQHLTPEVTDLLRTVACNLCEEPAVGEEAVAGLDDAELVAFGIGEYHMAFIRALTNVQVPAAESERPGHRLLLVLQRSARQMEVHMVLASLRLLGGREPHPEPGVIARQNRHAIAQVVRHLPAQDSSPEPSKTERVVRIEAD